MRQSEIGLNTPGITQTAIQSVEQSGRKECVLCLAPYQHVAIVTPTEEYAKAIRTRTRAVDGTPVLIFIPLCQRCRDDPASAPRVEAIAVQAITGAAHNPEAN